MTERLRDIEEGGCGENVGAYLLGALDSDELQAFERHLKKCKLCREDVASLSPVLGVLPLAAPQYAAPPNVKKRVMAIVEVEAEEASLAAQPARSPRRGLGRIFPRPAFAAGIATAALACGVAGGVLLTGDDSGSGSGVRTLAAQVAGGQGRARLEVGHEGTTLKVAGMPEAPDGRVYQVWLKRAGVAPRPTNAMFSVDHQGNGTVAVPGSLRQIDEILVTSEPKGGSKVPTGPSVVTADLASLS